MKEFDTICAIATALGEGGIAIIRISGDKALDIASKIFKPKSNDDIKNMKSYTMKYGHIYDVETNEVYKAYNGFTDEYDGKRYKPITDDMYLKKTSGLIEK